MLVNNPDVFAVYVPTPVLVKVITPILFSRVLIVGLFVPV